MIAMKLTIELDIGLSFRPQAALPQLVTDRETKTHRCGRSKRSFGHCRRRTEIPEAEPLAAQAAKRLALSLPQGGAQSLYLAGGDGDEGCCRRPAGHPVPASR